MSVKMIAQTRDKFKFIATEIENAFVIVCDDKDILKKIRGYMSDGGGEYTLAENLDISIKDIRNEKGEYVGILVLGYSEEEEDEE